MITHFLFHEGVWEGSGLIFIPLASKPFPLTVRWVVSCIDEDRFRAMQYVEVEGHEPIENTFTVNKVVKRGEFRIFLESAAIGMFSGTGVIDDKKVAWEFSHNNALEGLEVYELKGQDAYSFHAKYLGGDGFSTEIKGDLKVVGKR